MKNGYKPGKKIRDESRRYAGLRGGIVPWLALLCSGDLTYALRASRVNRYT